MHTFWSRLNAVFAFSVSVTASVAFACFLTTHLLDNSRPVDIGVDKAIVKNIREFYVDQNHDLGIVHFSLKANLTDVFNWNCKQLFLYLIAEYETPENKVNQVVLWDKIIKRGENAVLNLKKQSTKYYFFDDGSNLRGNEVKLSLHWNVIPNSGYMWIVGPHGSHSFVIPEKYTVRRY